MREKLVSTDMTRHQRCTTDTLLSTTSDVHVLGDSGCARRLSHLGGFPRRHQPRALRPQRLAASPLLHRARPQLPGHYVRLDAQLPGLNSAELLLPEEPRVELGGRRTGLPPGSHANPVCVLENCEEALGEEDAGMRSLCGAGKPLLTETEAAMGGAGTTTQAGEGEEEQESYDDSGEGYSSRTGEVIDEVREGGVPDELRREQSADYRHGHAHHPGAGEQLGVR